MVFEVEGKIALITGAATSIGFQCACELLRNGLKGITIVDLNEKNGKDAEQKLNDQYGRKVASFIQADVTKSDELKNAFASAFDEWKSLDIVVNNAGMMKDSLWEKEIAVNCNAVVHGCLLALEYMGTNRSGNGGIVVNVSSILGLHVFCGFPVYVGTKHFVLGMSRSFGQPYFYNMTGVKFLTICPGLTETPLSLEASENTIGNFEGLDKLSSAQLTILPYQKPESVAKGMYTLITQGENGSVWLCEGGEPIYELDMKIKPTRKTQ